MKPKHGLVFVVFLTAVHFLIAILILDSRKNSSDVPTTPTATAEFSTPVQLAAPVVTFQPSIPVLVTVTPIPVETMTEYEGELEISYYPQDLLVWQRYHDQPPIVVFENDQCTPIAAVPAGSYGTVYHPSWPTLIVRYNLDGKIVFEDLVVTLPEVTVHFYDRDRGWGYSDVGAPGTLWSCTSYTTIFSVAESDLLGNNEIYVDGSAGVLYQISQTGIVRESVDHPVCNLGNIQGREAMQLLTDEPRPHLQVFEIGGNWMGFRNPKTGHVACIFITRYPESSDGLRFEGWSYNYTTHTWIQHTGWYAEDVVVYSVGKMGYIELRGEDYVFIGDPPPYEAPPEREQR